MSRIRKRITYANVVSTLALVLVVGGGSAIAASQFGKETIPNNALKKESIGPGKLTKAAKAALTGTPGPKGSIGPVGPAGAAGPQGPQGPAGSARAFGWTDDPAGNLIAAKSKNATVRHVSTGVYCVVPGAGIDPATATLLVSPDFTGAATSKTIAQVREDGPECNAGGGGIVVRTWTDGTAADVQFSFLIP